MEKPSPTNDDIHLYTFDVYGRMNAWTRHGETVHWSFDGRGDLVEEYVTTPQGVESLAIYNWDDAGRQTSSTAYNPQVRDALNLSPLEARVSVGWNWDAAGRLGMEEITVGTTNHMLFRDWTLNAQGNWEVHTDQTGLGNFSRTTTLDSTGRRVLDQTAFAAPSSNITYSWAGRRMTQRVHNGNVSFDTGINGFGERITHTGTGPNGVFHTETLERDVLGRVRSQTHGSQAWNGQERWQGYEYDARHALSTSWEAWAPSSTAPSVGSHDTATNLSVASAAGGLGATASARERAPTLGSLQKIVQGAQDVWEAQRTATGHRLSEISDSNATWMIEHDPLGRVTAALDKEYEYDPLGKLVLARDTNGDLLESYLMTADGRIAQIQRHDAQGYTASMFAYDGSQMTASFTEGTGGTWTQDWQAVWGPGQDQLLEFHDFHTGKTFAVAQDHRNNVVALLDDATGTLDRVMHYTPEGLSTHYSESGQVLCDEEASVWLQRDVALKYHWFESYEEPLVLAAARPIHEP